MQSSTQMTISPSSLTLPRLHAAIAWPQDEAEVIEAVNDLNRFEGTLNLVVGAVALLVLALLTLHRMV